MGTWNYVVNSQYVDEYGKNIAADVVALIGSVAGRIRTGDREFATQLLTDDAKERGLNLPKKSVDQIAENLALAEHDVVVVSDEAGRVLAEFPIAGKAGVTEPEAERHVSPDDGDRPAYS